MFRHSRSGGSRFGRHSSIRFGRGRPRRHYRIGRGGGRM